MKKIVFLLVIVGFFASCEKNVKRRENDVYSKIESVSQSDRHYFDNGKVPGKEGVDYGCKTPPGNCLPTVTIDTNDRNVISYVFDEIESGDNDRIITAFQENQYVLNPYIDPELVSGVISGDINVDSRGKDDDLAKYMIFKTGDIIEVDPFANY